MYDIKHIILVFAQSRSGHHAIIDWLFNQYSDTKLFFNYNSVDNFDPKFSERIQYYLNNKKYYKVISNSWIKSGLVEEKLKEFEMETLENIDVIENQDKNLLILNYENFDMSEMDNLYHKIKDLFPQANIHKVIVLRDLLNLLASKIKAGVEINEQDVIDKNPNFNEIVNLWLNYCKYAESNNDLVKIVYNKWYQDDNYRLEILTQLKSDYKEIGIPNLATFGGGSSFDGYSINRKVNDMKFLERYLEYKHIPSFIDLWYINGFKNHTNALFGANLYKNIMNTTEIVKFGETTYEFAWIEGGEPSTELVSQVSGYVFNDNNEMLIVKNKNWTIPGGHPEEGESYVETLKREVIEESNVEIKNIVYLGQVKVTNMDNGEIKYQLRYTAEADVINDFEQKEFEVSERIFINPTDLTTYIPWANGVVFSLEVKAALNNK